MISRWSTGRTRSNEDRPAVKGIKSRRYITLDYPSMRARDSLPTMNRGEGGDIAARAIYAHSYLKLRALYTPGVQMNVVRMPT